MTIKTKLCIAGIGLIVLSLSLFLAQGYNAEPQVLTQFPIIEATEKEQKIVQDILAETDKKVVSYIKKITIGSKERIALICNGNVGCTTFDLGKPLTDVRIFAASDNDTYELMNTLNHEIGHVVYETYYPKEAAASYTDAENFSNEYAKLKAHKNISIIKPEITPEAQIQPDTKLLPYNAGECTKDGIYVSCDPEKYLIPDNEVVKAYDSWIYVNKDDERLLLYKADNPYGYPEGTQIQIKFVSDKEYLGKDDYWINPDYYLTHDLIGDCEDGAFAVASILESKGIKAKVVWGWLTIDNERSKDALVEFKLDGAYFRYFTGAGIFNGARLREKTHSRMSFEPLFMYGYGDSYYNEYRSNW